MRKDGPNAGYFSINTNQVLLLQKSHLRLLALCVCARRAMHRLCSLFMSEIHQLPTPVPSPTSPMWKKKKSESVQALNIV